MSSRKRKHNSRKRDRFTNHIPEEDNNFIDPALYVQAYEADIIRGPRGHVAALSLEVRNVEGEMDIGSGLIRLGGDYTPPDSPTDNLQDFNGEEPSHLDSEAIWVDRYDARLLLDPQTSSNTYTRTQYDDAVSVPSSPTGWSDLPSDAEDIFFFTAEETEDYRREKRRRLMEQTRDERLKARAEEDGDEVWGESDEEPEESQREIMRRTAKSVLASPNPAQLELRILANHGADARFAFLRGRWSRAWKTVKAHARADILKQEQKAASKAKSFGTGLVANYADSDDESVEDDKAQTEVKEKEKGEGLVVVSAGESNKTEDVEAAQELRRARAREWMASRRTIGTK
ncbi:hypothetical protein J3R30DRAFT_3441007 [Lentinula aciculospora]|uniref:Uncharacterized protein n=1 Tax=Lentinula aciculospora TaxID=153920 RepID=A0A9W9ANN5_9AGAR|nr:hypothetical protein J3R30DRAFT_3441007 [Lentinula aciculospora]